MEKCAFFLAAEAHSQVDTGKSFSFDYWDVKITAAGWDVTPGA
jgi:hypothetical protein